MALLRWCLVLCTIAVSHSALTSFQDQDLVFKQVSTDSSDSDNPRALLTDSDGLAIRNIGSEQLTICLYAFLDNQNTDIVTIFNYSSHNTPNLDQVSFDIDYSEGMSVLLINGEASQFNVAPPLNRWTHLCVAWSSDTGIADFYIDGELRGHDDSIMQGDSIGSGGYFILGANPSSYAPDFLPDDGVNGKLTQFNLWNYPLSADEVRLVHECQLEGNEVSWRNSNWALFGNVTLQPTDAPCKPVPDELTLDTLKNLFTSTRSQFERQLRESQLTIEGFQNKLKAGEEEIEALNRRLDEGEKEIESLKESATNEIASMRQRMEEAEKVLTSFKDETENKINSLQRVSGSEINSLTNRFEIAVKEFQSFKENGEREISSLKTVAGNEIGSLKKRVDGIEALTRSPPPPPPPPQNDVQSQMYALQRKVSQCCDN